MRIVRAMKQTTRRTIRCTAAGAMLLLASLAGAQNPAVQPPPRPAAPPPSPAGPPVPPGPPAPPKLTNEQASYLFGLTFGEQLRGIGAGSDLVPDTIEKGLKEGLQGKKSTSLEKQQVQEYVRSVVLEVAARNKTAAEEFLAKNGHEKGVQTTASGLQYKVVKVGDPKADPITATDQVTVNYRGKLLDGSEFDSSYARGVPATFPVGGVIKGWQEALTLMKPGAQWVLYVPPELAYGSNPRPGIPGNSLLIFDVELLGVKPKPAAAAPAPGAPPAPPAASKPATPPPSN
jgi:FKBP-type peptidyl-prolyl cis-trans isomerase FklB